MRVCSRWPVGPETSDTSAFARVEDHHQWATTWLHILCAYETMTCNLRVAGLDARRGCPVRNLDALLARLKSKQVRQVGVIEEHWYGRFAWILDGEGNRLELWEPVKLSPEEFERRLRAEKDQ